MCTNVLIRWDSWGPGVAKITPTPYATCSVPHGTITGTFTSKNNLATSWATPLITTLGMNVLKTLLMYAQTATQRCHMNCDLILLCCRYPIARWDLTSSCFLDSRLDALSSERHHMATELGDSIIVNHGAAVLKLVNAS